MLPAVVRSRIIKSATPITRVLCYLGGEYAAAPADLQVMFEAVQAAEDQVSPCNLQRMRYVLCWIWRHGQPCSACSASIVLALCLPLKGG